MKHKLLFFIGLQFLFSSKLMVAQNTPESEHDSIIAKNLFNTAKKIIFSNPDSAIILSHKGMELVKQNKSLQILGYRNISVGYSIMGKLDSAEYYCLKTLEVAIELNNTTAIASSYQNMGIVASQKGNNKQAMEYYSKITEIAEQTGDSTLIKSNLINLSLSYYKLGDYANSISLLMRGLKLSEIGKDTLSIINYSKNISNVYFELNNLDMAMKYALYLYSVSTKKSDLRGIGFASNSLGHIYQKKNLLDSALTFFKTGLEIAKKTKNKDREATNLHSIGGIYSMKKNFGEAEQYFHNALEIKRLIGDNSSTARTYTSLTEMYVKSGNISKAQNAIDSAIFYSRSVDDKALSRDILDSQRSLAKKKGDLVAALALSDSLLIAKDSMYKEEFAKHIAELETQYKTEQKQQELETQKIQIANQTLRIKQANLIILFILCASFLFFAIIGLSYYIYRKRQKEHLKLARINEQLALEKHNNVYQDLQLKIIKEKIAGQEEERTRIARELHDGVGSNLVSLKLLLEQTMSKPNQADLFIIASKVAKTIDEVRSISHNLLPPIFNHIAIDKILGVHIDDLNKTNKINFKIQFLPTTGWEQIASNLQIEIYRIIQELCSNLLKYSSATKVFIQLSTIDNVINILIEDNGMPFQYTKKGIGLRNINERLMQFNGTFIKTSEGNSGNTYHVQIPFSH